MTGRSTPEWIGKTPNAKIPPHVRLRIFRTHNGVCHISGRVIRAGEPWDVDHIVALCNGGEHRESNMAPALRDKHREKTAGDVAERARTDRKQSMSIGIRKPSRLKGAGFGHFAPQRSATRPLIRKSDIREHRHD